MLSLIILVPSATDNTTPIWGCKSVGKPGYGNVFIVALEGRVSHQTWTESSPSSTFPPISSILAVKHSKCLGIQLWITTSPFDAIAASINVPASIWSGTIEYVAFPCNFFTPVTLITSVPAPCISAPIVFKKFATSTTCGSLAALSIVVIPSASTAASITLIVAPTETVSM